MTAILVKRHPVLIYYTLAFAISWGAMLVVIGGPGAIPANKDQVEQLMPFVVLALIAGPAVTSLLLTRMLSGGPGVREIASRLLRWRARGRCYAFALLTAPLSTAAILLSLSWISPDFLPRIVTADNKAFLVAVAVGAVAVGGLLEELGWTGFVIPRLRRHHSALVTGLIVGTLWGAWHFLVNFWCSGGISGGLPLALFVPLYFFIGVAQLTAYRILMVWVYDWTESLLVATLMHGSLIASTALPILVPSATGTAFLMWFAASAAVFWLIVVAVAVSRPEATLATHSAGR